MTDVERLVAVAIRYGGTVYRWPTEGRHGWVIEQMIRDGLPREAVFAQNQGFVTSTGRFVTRQEAVEIARKARQLRREIGRARTLFSEDCW
jgi:hypothetical protein